MNKSSFEIRGTADRGRGLFAKKKFSAGEVIFQESPLISCQFAWNQDYGYLACDFCMRALETAEENVQRLTLNEIKTLPYPELCYVNKNAHSSCPSCGVKYCSAECQRLAWEAYHATICLKKFTRDKTHPLELLKETWKHMHYPPETTTIMLVVKIFAMIHQSSNKSGLKTALSQFFHETTNEMEQITHRILGLKLAEQLETLRKAVLTVVPTEHVQEWTTRQGFLSLMALIGTNGQGIGTSSFSVWVKNVTALNVPPEKKKEIESYIKDIYTHFEGGVGDFLNNEGSGLYISQSTINHSCRPNAEVTFPNNNHELAVKAKRDIMEGEEICISYLEECILERSRHTRQKMLMEYYLFKCKCVKCMEQADQPDKTSSEESGISEAES